MYAYLRGIYQGPSPDGDGAIILDVAGVGYEIILPPIVEEELTSTCQVGEELTLHVSAQSGRDQPWPVLFGFLRPEQKGFWELLKSVPRVGGRGAAKAMTAPIDRIAQAIQDGNRAFLDGLPGVTMDGADKMIASLRKKVGPFLQAAAPPRAVGARATDNDVREDAVAMLVVMGVRRTDALRAVDQILASSNEFSSVQDVVTEYLRTRRAG